MEDTQKMELTETGSKKPRDGISARELKVAFWTVISIVLIGVTISVARLLVDYWSEVNSEHYVVFTTYALGAILVISVLAYATFFMVRQALRIWRNR